MSEKNFSLLGERLREERLRIDVQQIDFADSCGVSRRTLSSWENGEATPNAAVLGVMATLGVDVLYVVTGARTGELVVRDDSYYTAANLERICTAASNEFSENKLHILEIAHVHARLAMIWSDIARDKLLS